MGKPINDTVITVEQLLYYYDGNITQSLASVDLTEQEWDTISESLEVANRVRESLKIYMQNPTLITSDINIISNEYQRISAAYLQIREIALANKDEYSLYVWHSFEAFDAFAIRLNTNFIELVSTAEANEAVLNALYLANSVVRVAALL